MPEAQQGKRLIFNDETVIEDGTAGYSEGFLWCWITGFSMQQAAQVFFDPEKTEKIIFEYGGLSDTYTGFTNCINISINVDGLVSVCMTKGVNQNV